MKAYELTVVQRRVRSVYAFHFSSDPSSWWKYVNQDLTLSGRSSNILYIKNAQGGFGLELVFFVKSRPVTNENMSAADW